MNQVKKDKELTEKIEWFKAKVSLLFAAEADSSETSSSPCPRWTVCRLMPTVL